MSVDTRRVTGRALGAIALLTALATGDVSAAREEPADATSTETSVQQARPCGTPQTAPCPLQSFMRARVATPLASNNTAALALALDQVAKLSLPEPSWRASWTAFARAGAAAARRGDAAGARASCKGCHQAWREEYRAKYRARPLEHGAR